MGLDSKLTMPCNPVKCVYGKYTFPMRAVITMLLCGIITFSYCMRVTLHMGMPFMHYVNTSEKVAQDSNACPVPDHKVNDTKTHEAPFTWTNPQVEIVLSGFYIGYCISHIPAGMLVDRYGGRIILHISFIGCIFLTFMTPVIAMYTGWIGLTVARVLLGAFQGPMYPGVTQVIARWGTKTERSTMGSVVYSGSTLGMILGYMITGVVLKRLGWMAPFFVWGGICTGFYFIFAVWMYSGPEDSRWISAKELAHLEEALERKGSGKKPIMPWKKVLRDRCLYALIIGQAGFDYAQFTLQTNLPTYMKSVLHFNPEENGFLASLPFLAMFFSCLASGYVTDAMIKKKTMSVLNIRRLNHTVSSVLPSIFLVIAVYIGCNSAVVITFMVLSLITKGPFYSGMKINVLDVTTHFSGTLSAISNGLGAITGAVGTYVVGGMAPHQTVGEWRGVMWVAFGMSTVTNILYVALARADRREWDYLEGEEREPIKPADGGGDEPETKESRAEEKKRKKEEKKAEDLKKKEEVLRKKEEEKVKKDEAKLTKDEEKPKKEDDKQKKDEDKQKKDEDKPKTEEDKQRTVEDKQKTVEDKSKIEDKQKREEDKQKKPEEKQKTDEKQKADEKHENKENVKQEKKMEEKVDKKGEKADKTGEEKTDKKREEKADKKPEGNPEKTPKDKGKD